MAVVARDAPGWPIPGTAAHGRPHGAALRRDGTRRPLTALADTVADVARSYESLWLWLGAGFIAGGLDAASKVPYSFWTSAAVIVAYVMSGLLLGCFGCAIRKVPIPYPISRRSAEPLVPGGNPGAPGAAGFPPRPFVSGLWPSGT